MSLSEDIKYKHLEYLSDINELSESSDSLTDKYIELKHILERICKDITENESLQFSSLFSRLTFISQKYDLPRFLEWELQNIRTTGIGLLKYKNQITSFSVYESAVSYIKLLLSHLYDADIEKADSIKVFDKQQKRQFTNVNYRFLRVQVLKIEPENSLIVCKSEQIETDIRVRYNIKNVNDIFNSTIERLWPGAQLNLVNIKIDKNGDYIPVFIVLEPDYLIDTSSISECFQNYGWSHLHYFRRKFEQTGNSRHILLGNLANFFLDELVFADNPQNIDFKDVFKESFKQKPFEYTSCSEIKNPEDFRDFMSKAKTHFENIKRVVTNDFSANEIYIDKCILEPSFFCEKFGFQGRLDLLQISDDEHIPYKIIELKSGGLPFPKDNPGKISINHEVQTTVYRLIIQSVFDTDDRHISSSILYSSADNPGENLRLAAPYKSLEKEIINIRNLIIATEHDLYLSDNRLTEKLLFDIFNTDNYYKIPDFFRSRLLSFEKVITGMSQTEKLYFYRFTAFISRELYIQKTGDNGFDTNISTASLWNTEFIERQGAFELIADLEIDSIDESGRGMTILFNRKDKTDFVNFREGDICILYPRDNENDSILSNQILKATIATLSDDNVLLRFRYKQKNKALFNKHKLWVIEHDRLDQALNTMFKELFTFLTSDINKRRIILGLEKPDSDYTFVYNFFTEKNPVSILNNEILNKAIAAKNYFLIVGPPGTGKTSVFAKNLIDFYYNNTTDNILIIAYTNRAVDELCEAIITAFNNKHVECDKYIRIGSELSCGIKYRHRLLQNIADNVNSRDELRQKINKQRIFVGTLASICGKPELFDVKKFNVAIIDEASQILEPQIIGILPKVDKFILIGDHKQLSTITLQNFQKCEVKEPLLNIIELYSCNESLFERLYRICRKKGWNNAYDTLIYHGRMHKDLSDFPNKFFYDNILEPISDRQKAPLTLTSKYNKENDKYISLVSEKRQAFINCTRDNNMLNDKINYPEADIVISLCKAILHVYDINNRSFDSNKTLGIITPYRNQIALIKHKLELTGIDLLQNIMVDTVERYQGSQRDIIIVSFCINKPYQLEFFSNMNLEQTVDRKLNVALTRAKEQLFLIGNKNMLRRKEIYRNLIDNIPNIY